MENPVDAVTNAVSGGQALTPPPAGVGNAPPPVQPNREPVTPRTDTVEISTAAFQASRASGTRKVELPQRPTAKDESVQVPQKPQSDSEVNFSFNKDLGLMTKQVVNSQTGKVEREIPPQELLDLRARIGRAVEKFKSYHAKASVGGAARGGQAETSSEEAA